MKVFTKLDLNMAFHQVELHPESRDVTTFAAPNGLYRYKGFVFGLNMASEKFNHITRQVVQDCPGAFNIHDDLIVGCVDDVLHEERVLAVVRKFAESGLTFNFEKLKFKVRKINFMGHAMSDKGMQVTENKVEAFVRLCYPCQLVGARPSPEPIRSTSLPQGPSDEIAIDLCGPLPNGESLLVVIDYFSRWPEVDAQHECSKHHQMLGDDVYHTWTAIQREE